MFAYCIRYSECVVCIEAVYCLIQSYDEDKSDFRRYLFLSTAEITKKLSTFAVLTKDFFLFNHEDRPAVKKSQLSI